MRYKDLFQKQKSTEKKQQPPKDHIEELNHAERILFMTRMILAIRGLNTTHVWMQLKTKIEKRFEKQFEKQIYLFFQTTTYEPEDDYKIKMNDDSNYMTITISNEELDRITKLYETDIPFHVTIYNVYQDCRNGNYKR